MRAHASVHGDPDGKVAARLEELGDVGAATSEAASVDVSAEEAAVTNPASEAGVTAVGTDDDGVTTWEITGKRVVSSLRALRSNFPVRPCGCVSSPSGSLTAGGVRSQVRPSTAWAPDGRGSMNGWTTPTVRPRTCWHVGTSRRSTLPLRPRLRPRPAPSARGRPGDGGHRRPGRRRPGRRGQLATTASGAAPSSRGRTVGPRPGHCRRAGRGRARHARRVPARVRAWRPLPARARRSDRQGGHDTRAVAPLRMASGRTHSAGAHAHRRWEAPEPARGKPPLDRRPRSRGAAPRSPSGPRGAWPSTWPTPPSTAAKKGPPVLW